MLLNISGLSKELSVSKSTLRRWEREGKIVSIRTSGKHRRYDLSEILRTIKGKEKAKDIKVCCYARVSTREQKSDLERQKQVLEMYCASKGYVYFVIEDFGSGLNYKKKGLLELLDLILTRKIDKLILTHRDRLVRFGFELIFNICKANEIEIVFINNDEEKADDSKEFVNDVLAIITHFSSVLYGKRSHKNKVIIEQNKKLFN